MAMNRTKAEGGSLFEMSLPVGAPEGSPGVIVFLTNRHNLLQILSAGYIAPRASYSKYYQDLLELCPGRIPLVRAPIETELQQLVIADDLTSFPVALELSPSLLSNTPLPCLSRGGERRNAPLGDSSGFAWAPTGAIPLSAISRVIFRSDEELEEHRVRRYENIDPERLTMSVDASIFAATAKRAEALRVWLHGLPPVLTTAREYFMCDRLSGARCLAVEILQIVPAVAESVLRLFPASPGATRKGSSERSGPTTAAWVTLSALTGVGRAAGSTDLNGRLFGACVQVFSNVDASLEWRPLEVLSEIERAVRAKKLIKKDDLELAKNFESIRGILRNEREFKPFKVGAGLDVAKSLLLLLLRPEPARLLSWPQSESGADAPVILTAATLCGLLAGREKLSVEIRAPDLDRVLADLAAGELSTSKDSLVLRPNAILGPLEIRRESGGRELLTAGATRIASWSVGPKSATEALLGFDLSGAESMKLALEICRILGWADCVRARVVVETGEVSVSTRGKGRAVEVEMSGWPELTLAVDASRFRERLTRDGVPRERENDVANLLGKVLE